MTDERQISKAVISRLPRYYRYLGELMEEGIDSLSLNPDTVVQTWLSLAELKK